MGGRGSKAGVVQITIEESTREFEFKKDIEMRRFKAKEKILKQESSLNAVGGMSNKTVKKLKRRCACCKKYSLHIGVEHEECPICGWIDDNHQNTHPYSLNGKNGMSLNEYREIYLKK